MLVELEPWHLRFSHLKEGWDGYGAPPPSKEAIAAARVFTSAMELLDYKPTRVAPSVIGGVGVTRRKDDKMVYVEFYNDGKVFALFSDGSSIRSHPVHRESYARLIAEMKEYLGD